MKKVWVILTLAVMMMSTVSVLTEKATAVELNRSKSTWLWDTARIQTESSDILDFLLEKQIDVLYLQVNPNIEKSVYQDFIIQAQESGIEVYALDGAPQWATSKGLIDIQRFYQWVGEYQRFAGPKGSFSGVHLDIEPYLLATWSTHKNKTIVNYQKALVAAQKSAQQLGLTFTVDMPFWFDEHKYRNTFGRGVLSDWVINLTDGVTIMAYRNMAEGPNGVIQLVANELEKAQQLNKPLDIALEATQSYEADYVSFYALGEQVLLRELDKVELHYQQNSSLNGFAIHSVESWMTLKQ